MREPGSEYTVEAWSAPADVASSRLTLVETFSALAAARRARRLTGGRYTRAKRRLVEHRDLVDVVELDEQLAAAAAVLAERRALRSHDAIQLASALAADALVSWDAELRHAAQAEGLAVAPPER